MTSASSPASANHRRRRNAQYAHGHGPGQTGGGVCAAALNVNIDDIHVHQATKQPRAMYFDHLMAINDVRVLFELACKQHGYPMSWLTQRTIRAKSLHVPVTMPGKSGRNEEFASIPDGFFSIQTPKGYYSFFVEVSSGAETHKVIHNKAHVYLAYEQTGHYAQYYSASDANGTTASLFALLVTSSSKRCSNIVASLGKEFSDQPFLCATYSRLNENNILTEPVWHAPQFTSPQPLITSRGRPLMPQSSA